MRHAEKVTFGGSGLDRAAHLRAERDALARLWSDAQVLPMWRGKPLVAGEGRDLLGWIERKRGGPSERAERAPAE